MLTLSRKRGESVVLTLPDGSTIRVTVAHLGDYQTRLAFEAPPEVRIMREELLTRGRNRERNDAV